MNKCIVCDSNCLPVRQLNANQIKKSLSLLMGDGDILSINIENYEILRCSKCELEFAEPQTAGSKEFYEWLVKNKYYYPLHRWEWNNVIEYIKNENEKKLKQNIILDVGCGTGTFLEKISGNPKNRAIGVDLTQSSVDTAKKNGLEAYCCQLSDVPRILNDEVDIITVFHVLEHVPDPLQFLEETARLLRRGGCIFISTPYSPMSIEENWYDPLNHPPHHITRWSKKSYTSLAERLGFSIDFEFPQQVGLMKRVYSAISIRIVSPFEGNDIKNRTSIVIKYIANNPMIFFKEIILQLRRKRINGRIAPDSVLVKLTKN